MPPDRWRNRSQPFFTREFLCCSAPDASRSSEEDIAFYSSYTPSQNLSPVMSSVKLLSPALVYNRDANCRKFSLTPIHDDQISPLESVENPTIWYKLCAKSPTWKPFLLLLLPESLALCIIKPLSHWRSSRHPHPCIHNISSQVLHSDPKWGIIDMQKE